MKTYKVTQDLAPEPALAFEDLQARVCAAIQNDPDSFRDDEAIAGEDGPPREEQDLLDELKAGVMVCRTVPEILDWVWKGKPPER